MARMCEMTEIWGEHYRREDLGISERIFTIWKRQKRRRMIYCKQARVPLFIPTTDFAGVLHIMHYPCFN